MVTSLSSFVPTSNGLESEGWVVGPPPTEELLAYAYLRMKETGVLDKVFYQGVPGVRWFLDVMSECILIGCYRRRISDVELVGMGMINKVETMGKHSKAEIGFAFLEGLATIHEKIALGRAMLRFVFDKYGYDSLFGTTPAKNPAAVAYAKRLGFTQFGPIENFCVWEGELCPVYISQLSRSRVKA